MKQKKYIVLERDNKNDGCISDSFGVFWSKRNAFQRLHEVDEPSDQYEYCVEEVDPAGSFADDEPED